jgi:hypothetical protein
MKCPACGCHEPEFDRHVAELEFELVEAKRKLSDIKAVRGKHDCGCEICSSVSALCPASSSSYALEIIELRAERDRLKEEKLKQVDYAVYLQKLIEAHCRGEKVDGDLYHVPLLNACIVEHERLQAERDEIHRELDLTIEKNFQERTKFLTELAEARKEIARARDYMLRVNL